MFSIPQVLVEQGLGKYCDPDFVRYTSREMQEALDMTSEEMDMAAHQLLLQERSRQLGGNNVVASSTVQSTNNNSSLQQQQSPNNIHPTKSTNNSNAYSKL